jgi:dolichyl-phosphate beta-glucosyltransferase
MSSATVIVPCYNEASRLEEHAFVRMVASNLVDLVFVNDGSTDNTGERLGHLCARAPQHIRVMTLSTNRGKAEAVRQGLLAAIESGARVVGYYDADLATPPAELLRLIGIMRTSRVEGLLASRVLLLGRTIERSNRRHYLGRVFAAVASLALGVAVYDTQCGAKLFRRTPQLRAALAEPFISRWAFDVELLGRLLAGGADAPGLPINCIIEEPLRAWRDIPGSKLCLRHMLLVGLEMGQIAIDLKRRRARQSLRHALAGASKGLDAVGKSRHIGLRRTGTR